MAEDRPISTVNSEYATPPPSMPAFDSVARDSATLDSIPRYSAALDSVARNSAALESVARDSAALESIPRNSAALDSIPRDSAALESIPRDSAALDSIPRDSAALGSVFLEPPRASFFSPGPSIAENSSRDSRPVSTTGPEVDKESSTPAQSTALLPAGKDSEALPSQYSARSRPFYRRPVWLAIALGALVALILAIILPVYFTVIHKSNKSSSKVSNNPNSGTTSSAAPTASGSPNNPNNPNTPAAATTGGDGSTVTSGNTTFVYTNPFGGYWVYDPNDPFNDGASPNSWTKPLNESWDWGTDKVYGVNLGGLFVLEPFISPALYEKYPTAIDEWTLSVAMAADTGPGGGLQSQLEAHYATFVTEQDFAEMAGVGLNWVRLPIPFWAIETWPGEPFLSQVCWKYIVQVFAWARKYGIRINLDLHTIPGSQNAFNHSGRYGQVNFLNGIMGIANAQRTLDYIRIITEFISQPEYRNVVPVFSIINEALLSTIGLPQLTAFYLHAHDMMRGITGYGAGNGPYIAIHDGFNLGLWPNFLAGSDRIILDTHPYLAFGGNAQWTPITDDDGSGEPGGVYVKEACGWGPGLTSSQTSFGVTIAGEFSSGYNPCGYFLQGVGNAGSATGDCEPWTDASTWDAPTKQGILDFTLASMDALQHWFFWTWKVGASSISGRVGSPLWSYKLGVENGWIPPDPRAAIGKCKAFGGDANPFAGTYSSWQTGGAGAGTIAAAATYPWPPATIAGVDGDVYAALPTYTPTSVISTLPPAQLTPSVSEGNGWFNPQDTAGAMITVAGCNYPNAWDSAGAVAPTAACPPVA